MRAKRNRRILRTVILIAIPVLLLAAVGAGVGIWMLQRPQAMDKNQPSAMPPQSAMVGLRISQEYPTTAGVLSASGPQTLDALFAEAIAYARAHGMNALLLDVAGDRLSGVGFLDTVYETWPGAQKDDTLFSHYDPLRTLCEQASAEGLAVYAVTPDAGGNADWEKAMQRLQERYAVAGVYTQGAALYNSATGQSVFNANGTAFSDPSSLFFATLRQDYAGVVFDYTQCQAQPEVFSQMASALNLSGARPSLLGGYTPAAVLSVSYPEDGAVIYTETCFLMGTSDPEQQLLLDGEPVEVRAPGGTFGILVEVPYDKTFTFTQGQQSVTVTVKRPGGGGGGGGGGGSGASHDATQQVTPGTIIRTTGWISSLLYDPSSDGNINETVRRGAQAAVVSCVETRRNGKTTWAYQLESGDYVMAYNTEVVAGDAVRPGFTGATAAKTATGEVLTFTGAGTPLAYTNIVADNLEMDFYDADFADDFTITGSEMVSGVTVTPRGAYTRVTLSFTQPIWGHTVEYADGTTQVILKKTPVRSTEFGRPLAGVTVLLDAGHGDQDAGAMGAAGYGAPVEKDVNLALTLATKYRLEQLGASVQTIRTDDSFLSLEERNEAISTGQPDFFIAIHHNSVDLTVDANKHTGTECYYFYPAGKTLAETLVDNVTWATGRHARGAMWGYYYVTRNTTCPAVLLEVGFMVNPTEYEQVTSEYQLWNTADAIARSVLECVPQRAG
ncbi:MAG: N-acetylmuramoyl-L-alanine amidase [Subdoligranulum sp.]|nr:N-acetylmuramoyl-L-alanine amidase [Subdoligranulum sp.]